MPISKLDLTHVEGNFINQIVALRNRVDVLERQAIKVDERDYTLPVGGISVTNGFFTFGVPGEVTIDGGQLVPTKSYMLVDTEGGAASDNLDWIDPADILDGTMIILQAADTTNSVVLRDEAGLGGAGNIDISGATRTLDATADTVMLVYNASLTFWCELSFANNA